MYDIPNNIMYTLYARYARKQRTETNWVRTVNVQRTFFEDVDGPRDVFTQTATHIVGIVII